MRPAPQTCSLLFAVVFFRPTNRGCRPEGNSWVQPHLRRNSLKRLTRRRKHLRRGPASSMIHELVQLGENLPAAGRALVCRVRREARARERHRPRVGEGGLPVQFRRTKLGATARAALVQRLQKASDSRIELCRLFPMDESARPRDLRSFLEPLHSA